MSSLAASRADNFYYPPEWRPEMGGISKFQGSKGANQYQQFGIIRFELPFDSWCNGCKRHMCKGLRFNAKKDKDGNYFSTIIYKFTTKCPSCEQQFIIRTDPKNATYEFVEGLRKMEQDFTPDADDSLLVAVSDETKEQLTKDPIYRLQYEKEDKQKSEVAKSHNYAIMELNEKVLKNDYDNNSKLRSIHRSKKRRHKELLEEGSKFGLSIPLVEANEADLEESKLISYKSVDTSRRKREKTAILQLQNQSIFHSSSSPSTAVITQKSASAQVTHNKTGTRSNSSALVNMEGVMEGEIGNGSSINKSSKQPYGESSDATKLKKYRQLLTKQSCPALLANVQSSDSSVKTKRHSIGSGGSAAGNTSIGSSCAFRVHSKDRPLCPATALTTSLVDGALQGVNLSRQSSVEQNRQVASSGVATGALALLGSYADEND